MGVRVFVDADVLFSRTLRDWLFLLRNACHGAAFTLGASEDVLAEVIARLRDSKPELSGANISTLRQRLVEQLDELVEDFTVHPWMLERDAGDAHVRAAATAGYFEMLLTCDGVLLHDTEHHDEAHYEPISPDQFFVLFDDSSPATVSAVTREQVRYFMKRDGEVDLPAALRRAACPDFAERVNRHLHRMLEK